MKSPVILALRVDGRRLRGERVRAPRQLESKAVEWVAVLDPEMHSAFRAAACGLVARMPRGKRSVTILVHRLAPPTFGARIDGEASSFICSAAVFRALMRLETGRHHARLTFAILHALMNNRIDADRVAVRQLPLEAREPFVAKHHGVSLIMAHRGKVRHLACALAFIAKAGCREMTVRVGLDLDNPDAYQKLIGRYPGVEFLQVSTPPTGPYVIRQLLASRSRAPLMAFHDSDDISCFDRFTALTGEIAATGCDLVGCHELRVDELNRDVTILRFPLDVSGSLQAGPVHSLLHPSSMVRRAAFFATGGFSTDRMIANDTQFLLRACFHNAIRNVDGFYYIRRKHANALTVAAATSLDHPLRAELLERWHRDFTEVREGRVALEQSSLRAIPASGKHRLIKIPGPEKKHA